MLHLGVNWSCVNIQTGILHQLKSNVEGTYITNDWNDVQGTDITSKKNVQGTDITIKKNVQGTEITHGHVTTFEYMYTLGMYRDRHT